MEQVTPRAGSGRVEPDPNEIVLEAQGVTKRFGDKLTIPPLDLDIRRGEFLTLLGPSGCGKTTLLRLIAGFETVSGGHIIVEGRDVSVEPPYRRGLGFVFQSLALFPHLDVARNIAFGLAVRRWPKKRIADEVTKVLHLVGLPDVAERPVQQLSGGQRQRIALARAIVTNPSILLLDEPLGALDLKLRRQMQSELKALQRRLGTTFIFVTHDQEEAISMSDRIAVMRDGQIEQVASPDTIYRKPASAFVAGFVGENNFFDGEITGKARSFIRIPSLGCDLSCSAPLPSGDLVSVAVRPEHIRLSRLGSAATEITGTIRQRIFLGSIVRYVLDVQGSTMLAERSAMHAQDIGADDKVAIGWAPQDLSVFERQPANF